VQDNWGCEPAKHAAGRADVQQWIGRAYINARVGNRCADDEVDHEIDAVGRQFAHFRAKTETLPLNAERQARDGTCRTVSRGRRTRRECDRAG